MDLLDAKPVRRGRRPAYPTKLQVLAMPELLTRRQPAGWLKNGELAAVAGALVAASTMGCESTRGPGGTGLGGLDSGGKRRPAPDAPALVAPLFVHGEGRGITGCVVVSPPSFLSEEEALVVIREELRGAGIDLSCTWVPVEAVVLPQVPYTWERTADGRNVSRPRPGRALLQLDALDPNARVGVEFISREDFDNIDGPWHNVQSSVIEYDFRKVARLVAHRARGKPCGLYLGVFYDPLTGAKHEFGYTPAEEAEITWAQASGDRDALGRAVQSAREEQKARWNENDRQVRLEAERLLREQVKDFIDWLKAQGAI